DYYCTSFVTTNVLF
nr:immunoglobulin light chain junction region [Macaca mulatta]MOW15034.1 immunoglobulin light chain junction region [Macaca mulatta]MOW15114.1 immunoglobulin light chain junction region [Macaca mulatta]MOW15453.1 immunoglobulin light chain junction region [Macaca mulatta]MOW15901.1 immunoglobulin light chain junction region [Macaca mulatta]